MIASSIKAQKRRHFTGWRSVYDHKHRHSEDKGMPYTFESAEQLLSDFFAKADKILKTKE